MKIVSVAAARADLASVLAAAAREPVLIARYGKPVGVVLGVGDSDAIARLPRALAALRAELRERARSDKPGRSK